MEKLNLKFQQITKPRFNVIIWYPSTILTFIHDKNRLRNKYFGLLFNDMKIQFNIFNAYEFDFHTKLKFRLYMVKWMLFWNCFIFKYIIFCKRTLPLWKTSQLSVMSWDWTILFILIVHFRVLVFFDFSMLL